VTVEDHASRWFEQSHDRFGHCGLPAAAFADEAERFARLEIKAHAIDGFARRLRRVKHATTHREVHLEVLDGKEAHDADNCEAKHAQASTP
jgi:hypothetical protein